MMQAALAAKAEKGLVAGDYLLTSRDYAALSAILYKDAGIALGDGKASLLYSRLVKRLRTLGLSNFAEYTALVSGADGEVERGHLLAAMTTNVTAFFRESHHFDFLRDTVLPPLMAKARGGGRVRLWSAACSTGPEPWSMAVTLLDAMPDAARYDIRILATDIDPVVLKEAQTGSYSAEAVAPVPKAMRRWFQRDTDGTCSVGDEARGLVAFRRLNLNGDWPMRGKFDAIFCRNVVIYFDDPTRMRIWQRFAAQLTPGGHLSIGHSERVNGPAADLFEACAVTTYRRKGARA